MDKSAPSLRMTRQRKIILEVLHQLDCHPTADELYEQVRKLLPKISLGTVYRNLEVLSEAGQILKLELAGTQKRFDWDARNHYHIRCIRCDRIDNAPLGLMGNLENEMKSETGYQVVGHRLNASILRLLPVVCSRQFLQAMACRNTPG